MRGRRFREHRSRGSEETQNMLITGRERCFEVRKRVIGRTFIECLTEIFLRLDGDAAVSFVDDNMAVVFSIEELKARAIAAL